MYMVLIVLDNPALLDKTLVALEEGGIRGATIIESTGLHRRKQKRLPMRYLYNNSMTEETDNITLFAIVSDRATAENCLSIVESVSGSLDDPDTGIFAAWELDLVKGLTPRVMEEV